jgi:hypothetical protein
MTTQIKYIVWIAKKGAKKIIFIGTIKYQSNSEQVVNA